MHDVASELPGVSLHTPHSADVAGYRVGGRLFAMCVPARHPNQVSVRLEPAAAESLAARYDGACDTCHLGAEGWVSLEVGSDVPDELVAELVVDAWRLAGSRLPGRTADTLLEKLEHPG